MHKRTEEGRKQRRHTDHLDSTINTAEWQSYRQPSEYPKSSNIANYYEHLKMRMRNTLSKFTGRKDG
ncbi:hypothetical protein LOAG_13519, partial [Loa loa]